MDSAHAVREQVRRGYAAIAQTGGSGGGCCGHGSADLAAQRAQAVGYAPEELGTLPDGANLGLSCGNPGALASLLPGEVVLDLGSGGGLDVFLAGRRVGPAGHVIGVDMTPEMLARARANQARYTQRSGLDNVEFRLGEIEHLPVADASVDVVLSNCVINLSPDKAQVWREIARVLKPGGRVAVSDIALRKPLPGDVAAQVESLIGCLAGAVPIAETERMLREAGLDSIEFDEKPGYVDAMVDVEDPLYASIAAAFPPGARPSDYAVSLSVSAAKPSACSCCC